MQIQRQQSTQSLSAPMIPFVPKGKKSLASKFVKLLKTMVGAGSSKHKDVVKQQKKAKGNKKNKKKAPKGSQINLLQLGLSKHELDEIRQMTKDLNRPSKLTMKVSVEGGKSKLAAHRSPANSSPNLLANSKTNSKTEQGNVSRTASSPVLVACTTKYVDRLKAAPLSLGETLSRWCSRSPMTIFDGHPPQDHSIAFPAVEYRDFVIERIADLEAAGHTVEYDTNNGTPGDATPRVEVVLARYPAGRHGLSPAMAAGSPSTPMLASPKYNTVQTTESKERRRNERRAAQQQQLLSRANAGHSGLLKATPQPMARSGTNMSMACAAGSSTDLSARIGSAARVPITTALVEEDEN